MERLRPCTQLYVSIDASNPVELKAVDRPIFSDFWERFLACVDLLAKKGQRWALLPSPAFFSSMERAHGNPNSEESFAGPCSG